MLKRIKKEKKLADLTQAEIYELYYEYGGYLNAVDVNMVNFVLQEMSYEKQPLKEVRNCFTEKQRYSIRKAVNKLFNAYIKNKNLKRKQRPENADKRRRSLREVMIKKGREKKEIREFWQEK